MMRGLVGLGVRWSEASFVKLFDFALSVLSSLEFSRILRNSVGSCQVHSILLLSERDERGKKCFREGGVGLPLFSKASFGQHWRW